MKGTKNFFTLLIFSIAVAFTGCPGPVGSLLYSVDYIKAVPLRSTLYGEGNMYIPVRDVKVIGVFGGVEEEINIDDVKIKLIFDPGFTNDGSDNNYPVTDNQRGLPLTDKGHYAVFITYKNMETRYDIAVGEPGMGDGGWGDGGGSGIILNWPP